jgi:rhamnulose-1-phosphate aldolase/alcohol dehydrogenase
MEEVVCLDIEVIDFHFQSWDDAAAAALSPVELLVYRSNLLGSDPRVTNTGGGNTSAKLMEQGADVLWVKGSGGDLRTIRLDGFAALHQQKLLDLRQRHTGSEEPDYAPCAIQGSSRPPSIDTPLHAFVPFRHVDHTHPNSVIAVAASRRSQELTAEIFGDEIGWTPWLRPGFALGLELERMCRENPKLKGVVLAQHGLINWAGDSKSCYELALRLIANAARFIESKDKGERTFGGPKHAALPPAECDRILRSLLPWLREQAPARPAVTVQFDDAILQFVNSCDAGRLATLGTSCPDHFLRTKIRPLYVESLDALSTGLENYRRDYAAYYNACKRPDSPPMRDPNPAVILIAGLGMIACAQNERESRLCAEFYSSAVEVMRGAEAIDEYIALPEQEAFDIEYWSLEEAKLRRIGVR